jgi:hypothetical protein
MYSRFALQEMLEEVLKVEGKNARRKSGSTSKNKKMRKGKHMDKYGV